jgi:flagellar M-ring protein FliF
LGLVFAARKGMTNLSPAAKVGIGLALAAIIGGLVYLWAVWYAGNGRYELLFSGLDSRDAAEVIQKLEQRKVAYRLSSGGATIMVPASLVHSTRLFLAGEGLPKGGVVGFELLDKASLGSTDFDRRMSYLRALSGELVRTIREIDGVEDARVHVAIPETTYFASRPKPATAAVFLKLSPHSEISRTQVKGIVHLVSRSVEGLRPEDVAVIDLYGRLLSGDSRPDDAGAGPYVPGASLAETFQADLEKGLQALLERVLGHGNVVTRVRAELDMDQKTVDRTLYQPSSDGIMRSMHELEETFKGEGTSPSGVPGTASNIPQYQTPGQGGSSDWHKKEATRNYEVSEIKERTVIAPGSVKRLSVAVVVNKLLDEPSRLAIERTVAAAIGFDSGRRDNISVTGMVFDTSMIDAVKKQMAEPPKPAKSGVHPWMLAAGSVVIALLLLLVLSLRRRRPATAKDLRGLNPAQAIMAAAEAATARDSLETLPSPADPEQERKRRLKETVERAARQSPENVAQLIRTWLLEDRR